MSPKQTDLLLISQDNVILVSFSKVFREVSTDVPIKQMCRGEQCH